MQMTISFFGPDGAVLRPPTASSCPDSWPFELARKRRNRNVVAIAGGIEFDNYGPGHWDGREDAEYMQAIRVRATFTDS